MPEAPATALEVESRSIDHIPDSERHGRPRHLFAVWFGANLQLTALVTGAIGPSLGLSLGWTLVAIVVGNLFGATFMALHSAQGPRLGIPQMIQSRAQFGFYGAIIPVLLVILMYIGFFASSGVLGGEVFADKAGVSPSWGIVIVSALCVAITIYGYRMIHGLERFSSVISAAAFVYLTIRLVTVHDLGGVFHFGALPGGTFLLMVAIAATWQIAYAPYVADYSRYLPRDTSVSACFWWSYAGTVIASGWMMAFGAMAAALAPTAFNQGSTEFIINLAPGGRWFFAAAMVIGVIAVNVLNLYGAFMSVTTTVTALRPLKVTRAARAWIVLGVCIIGAGLAIAGRTSFISSYTDFILFLTYFLVPWTAINLVDFYLVRQEQYDIDAIFDPRGTYGTIAWRAMGPYLLGVAVEIPFMNTSFYTGPMVGHLGGADISWILGLIVSAVAYYIASRPLREARARSDVPESDVASGGALAVAGRGEDIPRS